jgi:hypothetical protein
MAGQQTTKDRQWEIDEPFFVDAQDGEDLALALAEAEVILRRIGGAIQIVARREEVAPEMFATTGYMFAWRSYAPARRQRKPEPVPDAPVTDEPVEDQQVEPAAA